LTTVLEHFKNTGKNRKKDKFIVIVNFRVMNTAKQKNLQVCYKMGVKWRILQGKTEDNALGGIQKLAMALKVIHNHDAKYCFSSFVLWGKNIYFYNDAMPSLVWMSNLLLIGKRFRRLG